MTTVPYHFFIKVTGKDQGPFASDSPHAGEGKSIGYRFHFRGSVSNDTHRGKAGSARSHEPLVIVKPWGPSSPNFAAAFWANEVLSEVELLFLRPDGDNSEAPFHEIHLKNATIASLELRAGPESGTGESAEPELDYIGLRFEEMQIKNVPGKTVAQFQFKNH